MALLIAAVLLSVASCAFAIMTSELTCSTIANYPCRTGACANPGVFGKFGIPVSPTLAACPTSYGSCVHTGCFSTGSSPTVKNFFVSTISTPSACCNSCKKFTGSQCSLSFSPSCSAWQYRSLAGTPNAAAGGYCYLYLTGYGGSAAKAIGCGSPNDGGPVNTTVGEACPGGTADPHFVGHQGAKFDFNGMPGDAYCLITDRNLQINTKLTGYLDSRLESAAKIVDGKAVRTWMRELGFLWMDGSVQHSLKLVSRAGPELARGDGFLAVAEVDKVAIPRMQVGDSVEMAGGLVLSFIEVEEGIPQTEVYNVRIADSLDMDLRLRIAHKKLRTAEDAEVHFSFGINQVAASASIHGVLGQTYRSDRGERNAQFAEQLTSFLSADAPAGAGFLDGKTFDYVVSDVLSADCKFSSFNGREMVTIVE